MVFRQSVGMETAAFSIIIVVARFANASPLRID